MRSGFSQEADLHAAAREYAKRGWPVLPLVPRAKPPLTKTGLHEASVDLGVIDSFWRRWPSANIGLRTGVMFDALDIDGDVGRASLEAKIGPASAHAGPISRTGRGEHWLFRPTDTANRAGFLPKLDWRGNNGYIVAPPSIHPKGHRYEWVEGHGPEAELPAVPAWLEKLLVPWHEPIEYPIIVANPYDEKTDIIRTAILMGLKLRPSGPRYKARCIFHDGDNEASLTLYPTQDKFYCFGCGAWGNANNLRRHSPGGYRG